MMVRALSHPASLSRPLSSSRSVRGAKARPGSVMESVGNTDPWVTDSTATAAMKFDPLIETSSKFEARREVELLVADAIRTPTSTLGGSFTFLELLTVAKTIASGVRSGSQVRAHASTSACLHQPPTTNHQPPTTNNQQPPTTNHQPPTTNHQPPTYQPPTTIASQDQLQLLEKAIHLWIHGPFADGGGSSQNAIAAAGLDTSAPSSSSSSGRSSGLDEAEKLARQGWSTTGRTSTVKAVLKELLGVNPQKSRYKFMSVTLRVNAPERPRASALLNGSSSSANGSVNKSPGKRRSGRATEEESDEEDEEDEEDEDGTRTGADGVKKSGGDTRRLKSRRILARISRLKGGGAASVRQQEVATPTAARSIAGGFCSVMVLLCHDMN